MIDPTIDPEDIGYLRTLINSIDRGELAADAAEDPEAFAEVMAGVERICAALEEFSPLCRRCRQCAVERPGLLCSFCRSQFALGEVVPDAGEVPL